MKELTLTLPATQAYTDELLRDQLQKASGISSKNWIGYQIKKRSIDARRSPIKGRVVAYVFEDVSEIDRFNPPPLTLHNVSTPITLSQKQDQPTALIVGAGPAGLFAALRFLSLGIKPIIMERGKAVRNRRKDLAQLNRNGIVNPHSNYCFGEGGAGTYSDGKLYTRAKKRGAVDVILRLLAEHGAPSEICYEAHPHIGTNRLPKVIESIRKTIIEYGGEIHFNAHVCDLLIQSHPLHPKVYGVRLSTGQEYTATQGVLLATGHSARDLFTMLHQRHIPLEVKPFALGVRIEHPQSLIDQIQYHGSPPNGIGSASYKVVTQVNQRGVFSFCMCPGGIIAPASTQEGEVVVNGWSPYKRNGQFANSGMVVSVGETDFSTYQEAGPLAGMKYQEAIERKAFQVVGKGGVVAPAQRLLDFLSQKESTSLPECSYIPGVASRDLRSILPTEVHTRLRDGLKEFGRKLKGYLSEDALLVGVESRTSSPVRIPRDPKTCQHPSYEGLFPCGEGAGYAGGIVSAALDGFKCATAMSHSQSSTDLWHAELYADSRSN